MRTLIAAAILFAVAASAVSLQGPTKGFDRSLFPKTVKHLNKTAYLGVWYEVIQDKFTNDTFQNASYCSTATYGVDPSNPDRITVANFEHWKSVTGPVVKVPGYATQPNPDTYPGRLSVHLFADGATGGFAAPYWILKLGPLNSDGLYSYAVVSDEFRFTLFVLVRDVAVYKSTYQTEITTFLAEQGFKSFINKPVVVVQEGCSYN